jgi:predicted metal-dependent TIM-barrel fold hydrolase
VIEPAFWLGQPRTNLGSYADYLSHIIGFERFRAGQFGIRHIARSTSPRRKPTMKRLRKR